MEMNPPSAFRKTKPNKANIENRKSKIGYRQSADFYSG